MINLYDEIIQAAVTQYLPGYDWRLFKAQLWQESRLNPDATSPAGAIGIAQFMPATWEEWSEKTGFANTDPTDPIASINTGAAYMDHLMRSWYWERPEIDRIALALASYNAGKGNVIMAQRKAGNPRSYSDIILGLPKVTGYHSKETIDYVMLILDYWTVQVTGEGR